MVHFGLFFAIFITYTTALYIPDRQISMIKERSNFLERSIVDDTDYTTTSSDTTCSDESYKLFGQAKPDDELDEETYVFDLSVNIINDIHKGLYGWDRDMPNKTAKVIENQYSALFILLNSKGQDLYETIKQVEQNEKETGIIDACQNHKYWLLIVVARHVRCFAEALLIKHDVSSENFDCQDITFIERNSRIEVDDLKQSNWF